MKKITKKITIIFAIIGVLCLSVVNNIIPVKVSAHSEYDNPNYLYTRITSRDKGYVSVNNAYNYIMGTGAGENDDLYIVNYYQQYDDDNEYFRVIGFNALDETQTAQVYIKVVLYDANTGTEKEVYRQTIGSDYMFYTWYYCYNNGYADTFTIAYYDYYLSNNEYTFEMPTSPNGITYVSYIDTAFTYMKNNNNQNASLSLQKQEMWSIFTEPYPQDWFTAELEQRYYEEYQEAKNYWYPKGKEEGKEEGHQEGYDEAKNYWYPKGKEEGKEEGKAEWYPKGKQEGLDYNLHYFWLRNTLNSMNDFLSLQLFPGVNIGLLLGVPLVFGVLKLILFIWRSGD